MIEFIDTHQHFIYREEVGHSWTDNMPGLAGKSFILEDYLAATEGAGIISTVFMETGVDDEDFEKEIRFAAELKERPGSGIAALIASCRPERDEGFSEWLGECDDLNVAGFRRVLHIADDDLSATEAFRRNIRSIGKRGKTFDMCFLARQLPVAIELAKSCPDTVLILDHCGVPDIAEEAPDPWRDHIRTISEMPHVHCKLAGVLGFCSPESSSLETVAPYVDHVIESFGAARVIWGSDWPVVELCGGIRNWVDVSRRLLSRLSGDEADAISCGNAERLFRFEQTG